MLNLIEQEKEAQNTKISKPDFSTKTGRELLAFYLQSKFKKVISYDKKNETPIFQEIKPNFISKFSRRLIDNPSQKIMIAITGMTASGKTTICNAIADIINNHNMPIEIISSDNYFNDISNLIEKYKTFDNLRDSGYDVDAPESFQLELLKEDLETLKNGENVKIPQYLINGTGVSVAKSIDKKSEKIIVVEGMATLYEDLKDVFDIKIFVDIDYATQEKWFLTRAASRNQDLENAKKHLKYGRLAAEKYIMPLKNECDIIINGAVSLDYFRQFLEYLHTITNTFND